MLRQTQYADCFCVRLLHVHRCMRRSPVGECVAVVRCSRQVSNPQPEGGMLIFPEGQLRCRKCMRCPDDS
ncbi:hypothetical protein CEXT_143151 [Caerostris extrusa]|uniref:Uncharacterized protein n=1 Tax=Caerostris extrusa TaxID=172846 RepID=A0AAV4MBQ5_CAEEX|nr:hypothetical protein CEXT_143151 [Caerostris extrusa]